MLIATPQGATALLRRLQRNRPSQPGAQNRTIPKNHSNKSNNINANSM
jgi:hypothetical protein